MEEAQHGLSEESTAADKELPKCQEHIASSV